ncbi:phosphate ABC transporter permease PstA [Actinocorallia longicatena]|uniref:Phosphate transport system permease protein PstA n=1 Tax=Actinocorallia longicatena TaxID=111803 RepID=A0ABP6QNE0_9ACTN
MSAPSPALPQISARRKTVDRIMHGLMYVFFGLALVPLISLIWMVVKSGISRLDGDFLSHSSKGVAGFQPGGGAYHAIVGTLEIMLLTTIMAVPIAVLTAVYLVEYGQNKRLARIISFFVDVMTGVPSIIAGLFILAFWILVLGNQASGFAGALALAILMIPTVVRSSEEMLKLVPNELREASYALGVPRWRTITKVILPTAFSGMITGIMLAVARVMGETAPLLLVIGTTKVINTNPFSGSISSLPTFIWEQSGDPNQFSADRAWAGALTLILIIMLLNLGARLVARRTSIR